MQIFTQKGLQEKWGTPPKVEFESKLSASRNNHEYNEWTTGKRPHKYREFANIMPRRRLSLAAANLFSKSASPTAFAAARNWKVEG